MRRLTFAVLLTLPLAAWAQSTALTESEAVRLGLTRAELSDLERGTLAAAEADALAAGQIPNPTLGYSRDRTRGTPDTVEETWQLAQTFDVSGRRGLRREAAERRIGAAAASNATRRAEFAAEIRRRYYDALLKQQTVQVTQSWAQHFARVEGIVEKLARAGEASGYDRRRLAREREAAQARLAAEVAGLELARERLAALTGAPAHATENLGGQLLPPPPQPIQDALARLDQRADLLALSRRAEAAELEGQAAARGWVPEVTLGIGPKRIEQGGTRENGMIMAISLPLPVFDRQLAAEKRAAAEALNARAESALTRRRAEGELRGLQLQLARLVTAAADYRARAVATSPELLRVAEAAYQGGESTLLELLDAYRGALEAETTALDLESKARAAQIEYDLLTGNLAQ